MWFIDTIWEWMLLAFFVVAYAPLILSALLWLFMLGPLLVWRAAINTFKGQGPSVDGHVALDGHVDLDGQLFPRGSGNVDRN